MVKASRLNIHSSCGTILHESMETFSFLQTNLILSHLAFRYITFQIFIRFFQNVYRALKEKGKFVFSVQHPLITSAFISKQTGDKRGNWVVDDYFLDGERKEPWIGHVVLKYHRTIEQYFRALTLTGFKVGIYVRELQCVSIFPMRKSLKEGSEFRLCWCFVVRSNYSYRFPPFVRT